MIEYNLDQLIRLLSVHTGKDYTRSQLALDLGISRPVLSDMLDNKPRPEIDTINNLLAYFAAQGLPLDPADLFRPAKEPASTPITHRAPLAELA